MKRYLKSILVIITFLIISVFADQTAIMHVKSNLKSIGTSYAMYFTDGLNTFIPHHSKIDMDPAILTYTHPETQKEKNFLFIMPGYEYSGNSTLVISVTDAPILGKHIAVFEDGHVENISKDQFQRLAPTFGLHLIKTVEAKLNEETINDLFKLIEKLGAQKYKDRKAAKAAILKLGPDVQKFLVKHQNDPDFEIKVSIKEILKEFKQQVIRPLSKDFKPPNVLPTRIKISH